MKSHKKVDSQASAQPQRVSLLQEEGEKEILNFLKLLSGRDWLQLNEKKTMESQARLISWLIFMGVICVPFFILK